MLLSSSPVPWCNTGAAGTKSIYRKSQKTHEWTRRHTTDNNVLLWSYRCLIKSIISCLVFLLSSPVIDVCVLKLTGLQRCCIHLHTICQQQQQQQLTKRQSFNSITYTKLCQISSFILIFIKINMNQLMIIHTNLWWCDLLHILFILIFLKDFKRS